MSFFSRSSRSSRRNPYKYGKYGSHHYQKKGLLGKLFHAIGSGSNGYHRYPRHQNPSPNPARPDAHALTCVKCHAQIPAGSKFCLQCGEKVATTVFCANCGEQLPPGAKFCSNCGTESSS